MTRFFLHFWNLAATFRIWSFRKKNPYLKYVSSHFLILAIELHLVRFGSGAPFTFELHCSLPSTRSLLLLFRFTCENMLFCFIWLDKIVKGWVSHCFYFIPTKVEQQLLSDSVYSLLDSGWVYFLLSLLYGELYIGNIV